MKRFYPVVIAAVGVLAVLHVFWGIFIPARIPDDALVEIRPGTSVAGIAALLHERGMIRSPVYFKVLARLSRKPLKAGEYCFKGDSLMRILGKMHAGKIYLHRVLVPEGTTLAQIGRLLGEMQLASESSFMRDAANPALLMGYGIAARNAEGYLFPDTYFLPKGLGAARILEIMLRRFKERVPDRYVTLAARRGLDLHGLVTLASIVEKEAKVGDERAVIAGVFYRRLERDMRLQADPTVRYALQVWERKLTRTDLEVDSPYNTYRRSGLPPGPICSPGLAAIAAAAEPADVPYLYFVTRKDGSGRHEFSKTLEEHNLAVAKSKERARAR